MWLSVYTGVNKSGYDINVMIVYNKQNLAVSYTLYYPVNKYLIIKYIKFSIVGYDMYTVFDFFLAHVLDYIYILFTLTYGFVLTITLGKLVLVQLKVSPVAFKRTKLWICLFLIKTAAFSVLLK